MHSSQQPDFSYIINHLGEERADYFQAVAPPIIQTSNFAFPTVGSFREAFRDELSSHLYTRGNNPTVEILRKKLAAMEQTEDALAVSSGAAAVAIAVIGNVQAGDHIICVQKPYSWTAKLCGELLPRFGVSCDFVDATDPEQVISAYQEGKTKLIMLESPNSLTLELQNLQAIADWARSKGVVTVIDNSYCSPFYQNPASFGIDLVVHSGTKYLNGHSDVVWGAICGSQKMINRLFKSELMSLGSVISPHDAWLVIRGLRTFPLRVQKSQENALALLSFLEKRSEVAQLIYPLREDFPQYQLATEQMRGAGGLFSVVFGCRELPKLEKFSDELGKSYLMAVSWGGYESLHLPCAVFHNDFMPKPLYPEGFVRFYAGLESADFLLEKLEKALPLLH